MEVGAQANVEMQLAARRVALENEFLRDLLHKRGLDENSLRSQVEHFWQTRSQSPTRDCEKTTTSLSCQAHPNPPPLVSELAHPKKPQTCRGKVPLKN